MPGSADPASRKPEYCGAGGFPKPEHLVNEMNEMNTGLFCIPIKKDKKRLSNSAAKGEQKDTEKILGDSSFQILPKKNADLAWKIKHLIGDFQTFCGHQLH